MPDASEAFVLRETLLHANSDLNELHGDIIHIQAILDELRRKRESLRKFTIQHVAFLAPIRRLPAEILIEIFVLCLYDGIFSFSPKRAPSLIGQICRGWRHIVLSTQKLWSSVVVTSYRPSSAKAKLWISRAITAPLTIRLYPIHPRTGTIGRIQPVITVLARHCARWRHLGLRIPGTMVPCLSSIKNSLPWLESLQIWAPEELHKLDVFEVAPRLRSLGLGPGVSPTGLKVPWHQLTDLNTHVYSITECLKTLQLVPEVVRCTVHNGSSIEASIPIENVPVLSLPHLRFFSILRIHPDEIFKHLHLPIIHTLRVVYRERWRSMTSKDLSWFARQPFMSFLSCSSHTLRKLEIEHLDGLDSAHIAHCLRATPLLEELCLRGEEASWVSADFLRLLTRQANIELLVPDLEVLEISAYCIPHDHSVSMIESRWRIGGDDDNVGARLKRVRFEVSWGREWLADGEILHRLHKCRQEGMVISITDRCVCNQRNLLEIPLS